MAKTVWKLKVKTDETAMRSWKFRGINEESRIISITCWWSWVWCSILYTASLMCCSLDFLRMVMILLPLMAKYKSAMVYRYQSRSISNWVMIARSLLVASAKKDAPNLRGANSITAALGNVNVTLKQTGSLAMTGENQAGGKPKPDVFRGNHRDQLNGPHQFLMFRLHLSVSHFTEVLVSKIVLAQLLQSS